MITYYQQKEGKGNDTNILCPTYLLVAVYTFVIDMSLSRSFFKAQKTIENVNFWLNFLMLKKKKKFQVDINIFDGKAGSFLCCNHIEENHHIRLFFVILHLKHGTYIRW